MKKSKLHNIKNSGFKIPDNYFNQFEDNLLSELELKEKVASSGFEVPKDYFNDFNVNIKNNEPKVIPISTRNMWIYAASIAAAVVLLFSIPFNDKETNFASLDNETIENYLLISDFESSELNNLITNTSTFETTILEETLDDMNLEDYLYNNADIEDFDFE